jgi:regulator of protease activity HflC (stomatin/prohibitin superfamily)
MEELRLNWKGWLALVGVVLFLMFGGIGGCMYFGPKYRVWKQEMAGKAEYARAEQNRKIKIEEAKANLEAEKLNAQAEIERAKGAAEAIKIENGSITPAYIQYLWVRQQNANTNNKIIYIPTEAGLPILEAGRVSEQDVKQ